MMKHLVDILGKQHKAASVLNLNWLQKPCTKNMFQLKLLRNDDK
jgi:hypothetical protein